LMNPGNELSIFFTGNGILMGPSFFSASWLIFGYPTCPKRIKWINVDCQNINKTFKYLFLILYSPICYTYW
jgi:hypothetical protein